ncbi:MAG TPA: N-6 DNA methylase, partial [Agriterribacter sp.]|nr:N-6 DNA methylase [Agriterribacter sp.]
MGFSKQQHLQCNIDALSIAFKLEKEKRNATTSERLLLMQYSGFGGLKFVLNPADNPIDINEWRKTDHPLFAKTQELLQLLRENSTDEKQYRSYVDSMRGSVLTAFYTPPPVINAIAAALKEKSIAIDRMLEPSAGSGAFIESFKKTFGATSEISAYEKDLLTAKILKHIYPDVNTCVSGFEEIPENEKNSYDLVTSNIPFGDTSVFDLSYCRGKDPARVQAARSIHNYFFLKGTDMLRDGGLLAFITSQAVLNSARNEPIRKALMHDNNLVSAIRLPNNLFTDHAGTQVGSDLIVLQKNSQKQGLSEIEQRFCKTHTTADDATNSMLFENLNRVVHTSLYKDTDLYGRPAWIYEHGEGVEGIARDMKKML